MSAGRYDSVEIWRVFDVGNELQYLISFGVKSCVVYYHDLEPCWFRKLFNYGIMVWNS
jgi:hypothetical protein